MKHISDSAVDYEAVDYEADQCLTHNRSVNH
jgi:hypothetical protein